MKSLIVFAFALLSYVHCQHNDYNHDRRHKPDAQIGDGYIEHDYYEADYYQPEPDYYQPEPDYYQPEPDYYKPEPELPDYYPNNNGGSMCDTQYKL